MIEVNGFTACLAAFISILFLAYQCRQIDELPRTMQPAALFAYAAGMSAWTVYLFYWLSKWSATW